MPKVKTDVIDVHISRHFGFVLSTVDKSLGAGYKTGNKTFFVLGVLLILLAILSARNSHGSTNATSLLYHRFILEGTFLLNVIFRSLKELQY